MQPTQLPRFEDLPDDVAGQIDQACVRYERAWKAGEKPRPEDYLGGVDVIHRAALLMQLLPIDRHHREACGERVTQEDYLARFAEYAGVVSALFTQAHPPTNPDPDRTEDIRGRTNLRDDDALDRSPPPLSNYADFTERREGGMGVVWLCRDVRLRRPVAVKVAKAGLRQRPDVLRRFVEEAHLTGQLQHPNIPPVHEHGELPDGRAYFCLKWVEGKTLAEHLGERKGPAAGLGWHLSVFEQVCQAVAYAHSQGVIHRDLKPSNVMVGAFGEVQVMDWGLAKRIGGMGEPPEEPRNLVGAHGGDSEVTATGAVLGTFAYMPPEQARGEVEHVDRRSDVFSLGAILCEILTGQGPYEGQGKWQKARAGDVAAALERLRGCVADAEVLVLACACLQTDPLSRPHDAGQVAAAVGRYRAGVEERLRRAEVERARLEAKTEGERRRRRLWAALAAAVMVMLVGGGGGLWAVREQRIDAEKRQSQADHDAGLFLDRARARRGQGWEKNDVAALQEARAEAARAREAARGGKGPTEQDAQEALQEIDDALARAERNEALVLSLRELWADGFSSGSRRDRPARPRFEERYARAFRSWAPDLELKDKDRAASWLRMQPEVVRQEVLLGLVGWAIHLIRGGEGASAKPLLALADAVDASSGRKELRGVVLAGCEPLERNRLAPPPMNEPTPDDEAAEVAAVVGAGSPCLALWLAAASERKSETKLAELREEVRRLKEHLRRAEENEKNLDKIKAGLDPKTEPAATAILLAWAYRSQCRNRAKTEDVLCDALAARPNEIALVLEFAALMQERGDAREALEYLHNCLRAFASINDSLRLHRRRDVVSLKHPAVVLARTRLSKSFDPTDTGENPPAATGKIHLSNQLAVPVSVTLNGTAYQVPSFARRTVRDVPPGRIRYAVSAGGIGAGPARSTTLREDEPLTITITDQSEKQP
jgi:hypothetical protein